MTQPGGGHYEAEHPRPSRPTARQRFVAERTARTVLRRRVVNAIMAALVGVAALVTAMPLILILTHLVREGGQSFSRDLFTHMPKPVGESGGGLANGIVGTSILIVVACAIGLPVGVGAGLYLVELKASRLAVIVRFLADVLNGLPSIVMGIFAWQFLVRPVGHFSALAGGIALGAMMIPMVTRTTEEMVRLVPASLREAALALGYSRARTALTVVLRTATAGIVTGVLVAVARIAGETAPLIFTVLGNEFWSLRLDQPIAALPLQIFTYAQGPYDSQHSLAWAGALILVTLVFIISVAARFATRARHGAAAD
jgi:phosphate transport system permease protein